MKSVMAGALALAVGSASALAAVQSVSAPFTLALGGGQQVGLTLPGFDPALGTLESVRVSLNATVSILVSGENRNPQSGNTYSGSYNGTLSILGLPGQPVTTSLAGLLPTQTVGPFGSESGFVYAPGVRSTSGAQATNYTGFEAPGLGNPVNLTIRGDGQWAVNTTSSGTVNVSGFQAVGDVTIEYTYTAVPTPGTAVLGLVGGLLAARRRR